MPLLPIDLFRRPIFSVSVTTSVLCFIAQGLAFVSLPFYFQDVIGVSAVATGLLMTPWPATSALMAPFAGRLADRYPAGILGSIGLAIVGVGFVLLAVAPAHPGTGDILWRIAVCGGGMGLFQQPNARAFMFDPLAGLINSVLITAGLITNPVDWLGTPVLAFLCLILGEGWRAYPFIMLILLAGLQAIHGSCTRPPRSTARRLGSPSSTSHCLISEPCSSSRSSLTPSGSAGCLAWSSA